MDHRLAELNNSMATLTGRVDDMDKCLEEFESMRDFEDLRGEVQAVVNSMVTDVNKEVQALKAPEVFKNAKIHAFEERI